MTQPNPQTIEMTGARVGAIRSSFRNPRSARRADTAFAFIGSHTD
jgi:hypothetical protein